MYICIVLMPIGMGLISTFAVDTDHEKWIGCQVLLGFGIGIGMQQPSVTVQTVLNRKDVPTAMALIFFTQV